MQTQTAPNSGMPALAMDPVKVKSERQRKAMYAALAGRSTLGIPKSVAAKFVGPGAHDMSPEEWDGFISGMRKFFEEERREPEHASDADDLTRGAGVALRDPDGKMLFVKRSANGDQAGTWAFPGGYVRQGENEEAAAIRELGEEIGFLLRQPLRVRFDSADTEAFKFSTFVHDVAEQFEPELNDESTEYKWVSPDEAPQPLHPGVKSMLEKVSGDPIGGSGMDADPPGAKHVGWAHDDMLPDRYAFDRASVRTTDADGRMHIAVTNISKANVCPYLGKEIPDWQSLGLQPDKIYQLLRDPDELRKAAPTFNNLPLLSEHVPVNAENHQPDLVIGSTGTDSAFTHPYLKNSLVVWAKDAIDAIKSDAQKELSSAYRYRADMTPGYYQGARYDGVMRNIVGNHVALVKEGRAGTDVVVGDSKAAITNHQQQETYHMSTKLSRTAAFVNGALVALLLPKLAQDAKMPDLAPVLADVTSKNLAEMRPKIKEGITAAFKDVKLAKDADLEGMHSFIDRLDKVQGNDEDPEEEEKKKGAFDEEQSNGLKEFLKDKLSEDNMKALDAYLAGDDPPEFAGQPVKEGQDEEKKEDFVDQKAMDEAIKVAVDSATAKAIKTQQAIREAERFVRPWVGELVACDSAEAVHRAAAKILGIDGADTVHPDALPALIKAQPKPGDKRQETAVAMDAAALSDFNKMFPGASRIGIV